MSIGSLRTLDIRKAKELKVLQLHDQGYSYRKIATSVHLSLRDVTKFINLASNKIESPSLTSIHDEIVLEYRVILLRSQVKDLNIEREKLKDELADLRAKIQFTDSDARKTIRIRLLNWAFGSRDVLK